MLRLIQLHLIFVLFLITSADELPDSLVPVEYKLEIITNLGDEDKSFNFNGSVLIQIKCISSTDSIILHSKNHSVDEGRIALKCLNETEDIPTVSEISQDIESDFLIIKLSQALQEDHHYELELHFYGDIEEEKVGFYRSSYLSENDETLWLAVTYFKPDNARRAFPCFDDLRFKANFTITLGRSTKYKSVSNMPLLKTEKMQDKPGWELDHFQTTPPMSTYILGFAIVRFSSENIQEDRNPVKIALSVWGEDDVISSEFTHRAVEFAAYFLYIFQTDLKMFYPLPKLDMIAIPNYAVPVMESWGLIIWQEDYLVQVTMAVLGFNSEVLGVVADQMVRQIFGNLVTIKSWNDVWFVDGFGAYISPFVVDSAEQGFGWLSSEITDNFISVFNFDSLQSSRAVSDSNNHTEGIVTTIDAHTGKKISLLVRMISNFVGHEPLRKVIQEYLKIYEYKNAGSDELLDLTNKESPLYNINVKTAMNTWITQPGFPLVTVTRNYKRGTLQVKQERFFADDELLGKDSSKWWIPLTYTTECDMEFNRTMPKRWLSPSKPTVSMKSPLSPADWVIFNIDATALYIVNYDEENWHLLIDFLKTPFFERIPTMNRVLLIESAARLAWVGRLDYRIFFDMVKYVEKDDDLQPIYAAVSRVYDLNTLLKRMPVRKKFIAYSRRIFHSKEQSTLSAKNEMTKFMLHNGRMSTDACKYPAESCMQGPIYPQRRSMMTYILVSLENLVEILCTGKTGKQYSWTEYMESVEIPIRKLEILLSITCCKNQSLLREYLDGCLNEEILGQEDIVPIIIAVVKSEIGFELVTEFISEHIKTVYDRISPNVRDLSRVISQIARHIVSEEELTWLKNFIDTNGEYFQDSQKQIDAALEIANLHLQWYQKRYENVENYFKTQWN